MGRSQRDLDSPNRAERKIDRICSQETYKVIFEQLGKLPETVHHLIIQLGQWDPFLFARSANVRIGIPIRECP